MTSRINLIEVDAEIEAPRHLLLIYKAESRTNLIPWEKGKWIINFLFHFLKLDVTQSAMKRELSLKGCWKKNAAIALAKSVKGFLNSTDNRIQEIEKNISAPVEMVERLYYKLMILHLNYCLRQLTV